MKENQPGLDGLTRDPKAAGLLKNRALLNELVRSPDARKLMACWIGRRQAACSMPPTLRPKGT